ncbi:putative N-acetyl-gamma-glutamyl-phosphate reductase, chloroplastic [Porphyridium purpureum]|uniref:N-acetyl-gamma-glutamyl-phosphate reductase n=1 Tax=Porphyridium purpureum TaxID=35688 RepID=A0A5J4YWX7_PORPP|nr:putative N-acetyl-gamma-glutamyl-phosphate reductase, chloroplastic [Porphyridium purpureum]|eukprot:POR4531..scf209_3
MMTVEPNPKYPIVKVGVLGASGYTGAELVRLLASHGNAEIMLMTAEKNAGADFGSVFPQYAFGTFAKKLPKLIKIDEITPAQYEELDVLFCCLPHALTQEIVMKLPLDKVKVVDLSADFRLADVKTYATWYGHEHLCPDLQKEAVYGLTELMREQVGKARLVANPGCYPTAAQLPLIPLLKSGLILADDIIIDAKSGATGAGRAAKVGALYCEVTEGIHAYGVASHRHAPEIEQGLTGAAKKDIVVNFTPHLMPMSRGILESIYVKLAPGKSVADLRECLEKQYEDEPFVHVLPSGVAPQTRHVRGSNHVVMGIFEDRVPDRAIIISVIDNVVKGASGQALQNMNVMMGLPETMGLELAPVFP